MTLDRYLSENKITQVAFAESIGVCQSAISRLRSGKLNPPLSLLNKIFDATAGDVTPNDFLPFESTNGVLTEFASGRGLS